MIASTPCSLLGFASHTSRTRNSSRGLLASPDPRTASHQLPTPTPIAVVSCIPQWIFLRARTTVSVLLYSSCPSTVTRFVISVVINAVQKCAFWPLSHVCKKQSEVVPSITDQDPSRAVILKTDVIRICATFVHFSPRDECSRMRLSVLIRHYAESFEIPF